jgi:hypothetical protein
MSGFTVLDTTVEAKRGQTARDFLKQDAARILCRITSIYDKSALAVNTEKPYPDRSLTGWIR